MGRERIGEVLVAAALNGQPQVMDSYQNSEGLCALGVLHVDMHGWMCGPLNECVITMSIFTEYGLNIIEQSRIAELNDKGMDFLTIARKWENEDA